MDTPSPVKAGARHSAADVVLLQTIHDAACALGAACACDDEAAEIAPDDEAAETAVPTKATVAFAAHGPVKALDDKGRVGGYLVRFSTPDDPDLYGEFFTPDTYFGAHGGDGVDTLFHHGIPVAPEFKALANVLLPPVRVTRDAVGLWAETVLDLADEYQRAIHDLVQQGVLGWSSGSAEHMVQRTPVGKAVRIDRWPVIEASLTPTPAEYRNVITPLKALATLPATPPLASPSEAQETPMNEQIVEAAVTEAVNETVDVDAIKAAVKAELLAELKAEPAVKSVGVAGPAIVVNKAADEVKAFDAFLRDGVRGPALRTVKAAMNEGTAAQGGVLVPSQVANEVIQPLSAGSLFRKAGATVTRTTGTDALRVPAVVGSAAAVIKGEGVAYSEIEPTLRDTTYKPWKYTRLSLVSEELLEDSRVDVFRDVLAPDAANAFIKAENDGFANGDGSTGPAGLFNATAAEITVGVTAASTTAITADEVISTYFKLPAQYRDNAVWMMNDATAALIRKLTNVVTGAYLWGDMEKGAVTLMGRPVIINASAPNPTAANIAVVFGDFSYYRIVEFGSLYVQRLNELYAANGRVGFRWFLRMDGHAAQAEAFTALQMKA